MIMRTVVTTKTTLTTTTTTTTYTGSKACSASMKAAVPPAF
jgi:hypothetical protein